ncbi:hypothetical protein BDW62DRAFT_202625 [Aspergillus aurantiobrunneus]
MTFWDTVKSLFGVSERQRNHRNPSNRDGDEDNDPCGSLSEVAAPEPVQRRSPEEQVRRPSLEKRLSDLSISGHTRDDNLYANLSELATPEPIERLSPSEMVRRPSLEQSLSRSH